MNESTTLGDYFIAYLLAELVSFGLLAMITVLIFVADKWEERQSKKPDWDSNWDLKDR